MININKMEETKENNFEEEELNEMSLKRLESIYKERGFIKSDLMTKKDFVSCLLENREYGSSEITKEIIIIRRKNRKRPNRNNYFSNENPFMNNNYSPYGIFNKL